MQTRQETSLTSLVLGLGATGVSCLEYLAGKTTLLACDDNLKPSRQNELQSRFPSVNFATLADCLARDDIDEVIASPGIADSHPLIKNALDNSISVVCDIELFARAESKPVIAITGTNGKSTVVSWLAHVLNAIGQRCALGGNIGVPALELLKQEHDCCVLELSSFQLERTASLAPAAALILNISSDHLDRYVDVAGYQKAKERIYHNAEIAIINRDADAFSVPGTITKTISFGLSSSPDNFGLVESRGQRYLSFANTQLVAVKDLPLIGEHNVSNALAVLACAVALGVALEPDVINALLSFKGLEHRTELVAVLDGVPYINDSKATNAGATVAAVHGDLDNIILLAGGDSKHAELEPLRAALQGKLKAAIVMGQDADLLEKVLAPIAPCVRVDSIEQAVHKAHELAARGDTVLLSPACSSLDMFKNYIERGERFKAAVLALSLSMDQSVNRSVNTPVSMSGGGEA